MTTAEPSPLSVSFETVSDWHNNIIKDDNALPKVFIRR